MIAGSVYIRSKTTDLDLLGGAGLGVVDLAAHLAALVGPWEVGDGDDEEGIAAVGDTGESVVPRGEGGEDTEDTTSLDAGFVGAVKVANAEHEEGQVEHEEEEEEGYGGAERADEQEEGEDEPALDCHVSVLFISRNILCLGLTMR